MARLAKYVLTRGLGTKIVANDSNSGVFSSLTSNAIHIPVRPEDLNAFGVDQFVQSMGRAIAEAVKWSEYRCDKPGFKDWSIQIMDQGVLTFFGDASGISSEALMVKEAFEAWLGQFQEDDILGSKTVSVSGSLNTCLGTSSFDFNYRSDSGPIIFLAFNCVANSVDELKQEIINLRNELLKPDH